MDLEDFEFDLSDVAAFESVATEDTTNSAAAQLASQNNQSSHSDQQQQQQVQPQHQPQQLQLQQQQHLQQQQQRHPQNQQHSQQPPQPPPPSRPPQQITSAAGTPGTSPLTMGTLTTTGTNQRPMIQLTPLSSLGKNNYSFPITTTSQLLPGSSQGYKQPQQLYFTTTATPRTNNSSPIKNQLHQASNLNSILNKSLSNLQNSSSHSSQFNSANLSSMRNVASFQDRAPTPNSVVTNEVPKRKPCNCTKSQCLKLYCDCFANGEFCSGCNCTNCFNSLSKEKERQTAIQTCLERNPEAFRPKIGKAVKLSVGEPAPDAIERRHTKGCNCKRSGCLKNYCECYEAKILCSNLCKCCGCKNYEESFERKTLMQLANSASENARGILKNLLPTNNNSSTGKEFTKSFITDKVIHASLMCLLQSAQQAEKDGAQASNIPNLIQVEMGKCLRMIVDSATESFNPKKR